MAKLTEKETVITYQLELTEKEAVALQHIIGVFWPNGIVGDISSALDDVLGQVDNPATTLYWGSVFENLPVEEEMTYKLDEKALNELVR